MAVAVREAFYCCGSLSTGCMGRRKKGMAAAPGRLAAWAQEARFRRTAGRSSTGAAGVIPPLISATPPGAYG